MIGYNGDFCKCLRKLSEAKEDVFMIYRKISIHLFLFVFLFSIIAFSFSQGTGTRVPLPTPDITGGISLNKALSSRRSIRSFNESPLTKKQISQIVWSGLGRNVDIVTGATRTAPSAGGLYPGELYVVIKNVEGLSKGVYQYDDTAHALFLLHSGDILNELNKAAYSQQAVKEAAAVVVIGAVVDAGVKRAIGLEDAEPLYLMPIGHPDRNE